MALRKGRKASAFKRAMANVKRMKGRGAPGEAPDGKLPPWLNKR